MAEGAAEITNSSRRKPVEPRKGEEPAEQEEEAWWQTQGGVCCHVQGQSTVQQVKEETELTVVLSKV